MTQFEFQNVSIHGHDVIYRMRGDGPAMLLIPAVFEDIREMSVCKCVA